MNSGTFTQGTPLQDIVNGLDITMLVLVPMPLLILLISLRDTEIFSYGFHRPDNDREWEGEAVGLMDEEEQQSRASLIALHVDEELEEAEESGMVRGGYGQEDEEKEETEEENEASPTISFNNPTREQRDRERSLELALAAFKAEANAEKQQLAAENKRLQQENAEKDSAIQHLREHAEKSSRK
jgi:hypothetical protein